MNITKKTNSNQNRNRILNINVKKQMPLDGLISL